MQTNDKTLNSQCGLTLTEILVAVVVLSIGLLGMAGIQMKGLRGTHNTYLRSQATALATDLAERIRSNPMGISRTVGTTSTTNYGLISFDTTTATTTCNTAPTKRCTSTTDCDAAETAEEDIYTWMCGSGPSDTINGVRNILPTGATAQTACVDSVPPTVPTPVPPAPPGDTDACSPGSTITVTINWDERDTDANISTQNLSMVVVP